MSTTVEGAARQGDGVRRHIEVGLDPGGLLVTWVAGTRPPPDTDPTAIKRLLTPDEIAAVLSVAGRAPSLHNTQPWRIRPRADCFELFADPERMLRAVDPDGRELTISCGAALFGLRLGLRRIGRLAVVELQPDPAQPWLLARVWPAGHAARTQAEADLIAAVPHRHTHRGPFTRGEVPGRLVAAMVADAAAEGCELALVSDTRAIRRLDRLVRAAAAWQQAEPAITAELAHWVRALDSQARDGVPATARLAAGSGATLPGRLPGRDFGLPGSEEPGGEPASVTAVLRTAGDTATDWLRAGQALDRVLLRAAGRWVFASMQSQPLESPRHRHAVRTLLGSHGYPQMVLQFGRANTAIATPRRPQAEMLAPPRVD
jgi:hypothetical protein